MPGAYRISVYNKDGSEELLASTFGDFGIVVQSDRLLWNGADYPDSYVLFSNTNVIGYATALNATVAEYPIGTEYTPSFGSELTLYEVESDPYNITLSKNQIIVKCKDKTMEKDLQISFEGGGELTWKDIVENDFNNTYSVINGDYSYVAKNDIDMYSSYSSSMSGIWHKNLQTGEISQIYTDGYSWRYFFEDSEGNIYVGSDNSYGIIHLNGTTATKIYTSYNYWCNFFEDSKGNVYISSDSDYTGILLLDGTTVTKIYNDSYYWQYFFEDSKGNVYVSSYNSSTGIVYLDGATATKIYANASSCKYFFEDSRGNLYVGGDNGGVIYLDGSTATQIYKNGYNWQFFFEDSIGNVYVSSSNSSSNGIVYLDGATATQIYTNSYNWKYFLEANNGNVYAGGGVGIIHLNGTTVTQIYTLEVWRYFFKDSKGNVYAGSHNTNGIIRLNGSTATKIYDSGSQWQYFFEDSKGNVYASSSYYNSIGILYLSGSTATKIYEVDYKWQYFFEDENVVYVTKEISPIDKSIIVKLVDKTATTYTYKEVQ